MAKLKRIRVDVLMVDGTEHAGIEIIGADRQRWSEAAHRHKWPSMQDDPDLWVRFLSWSALYRLGKYPQGYESFCADVSAYEVDEGDEVDPTGPTTTGA
ncbi:hypothetical protein [Nocardia sp. NPDC057272]|uniref:hypothetical protein n=1 Tax=Nocardia sp. NPDC057272 TaxID=3346079 RepID=UPI003627D5E7